MKEYSIYVTNIDVYTIEAKSLKEATQKAKKYMFSGCVDRIKQIPKLNTIRLVK